MGAVRCRAHVRHVQPHHGARQHHHGHVVLTSHRQHRSCTGREGRVVQRDTCRRSGTR